MHYYYILINSIKLRLINTIFYSYIYFFNSPNAVYMLYIILKNDTLTCTYTHVFNKCSHTHTHINKYIYMIYMHRWIYRFSSFSLKKKDGHGGGDESATAGGEGDD